MKNWRFSTNISLYFKMVQDKAIVTMEDEQEYVCDLSDGAIFNDFQ